MIVVRLNGGLGNQMFQYAAGYALAKRLGTVCKVDIGSFRRSIRKYELTAFVGSPAVARDSDLPLGARLVKLHIPTAVADAIGRALGRIEVFEEGSAFVFDKRFSDIRDNSYLIGYFQSQKYFDHIALEIRAGFCFADAPNNADQATLDEIASCPSVSLHVRRGDYVSVPNTSRYYAKCSDEYYQRALAKIGARVRDPKVFVFSDDPTWAAQNIRLPVRTVYLNHNDGAAGAQDMRLMSHCQHHIMANSSFSWWAAWLAQFPDKIVIAPKRWLSDESVRLADLLPAEWIAI